MQEARILIMDDEAPERKRIEDHLRRKGYDVLGVGTVQEAVDESAPPVCIWEKGPVTR